MYLVAFFDEVYIKTRDDNELVSTKVVQISLGVDASGRKEVLIMWIDENDDSENWFKVEDDKVEDDLPGGEY